MCPVPRVGCHTPGGVSPQCSTEWGRQEVLPAGPLSPACPAGHDCSQGSDAHLLLLKRTLTQRFALGQCLALRPTLALPSPQTAVVSGLKMNGA